MKKKVFTNRVKFASYVVALTSFTLVSACGPVVRVKISGTKDGVSVQTTQTAHDSTGLNINVNPNISLK